MGKKWILVAAAVAVGGVVFAGTKYFSYAKHSVTAFLDKQVSPEQEIERLRGEVAELTKDVEKVKDDLAGEIAQCEKLGKQTKDLRAKVDAEEKDAMAFGDKIKDAEAKTAKVSVGNSNFSVPDAKQKLKDNVATVVKRKQTLELMNASLAQHEQSREALRGQMDELLAVKQQLSVELDGIATQYKMLKMEETKNKYHRDDTRLSQIRESLEKLKEKASERRIRVGLDTEKTTSAKPTATNESTDDIIKALDAKPVSESAGN